MECPLTKRRRKMYGRMALGLGLVGFVYNRPPQNLGEMAVVGAGAYIGLMAVDHLASTYPNWSMYRPARMSSAGSGATGSACGCRN